jgi:hypothetical protein
VDEGERNSSHPEKRLCGSDWWNELVCDTYLRHFGNFLI